MAQRRRKGSERKIAHERIDILFRLAEREALKGNLPRANRYAGLAAKIGMRYNVRLPREFRRRYCRKCHAFLVPGKNCRVRVARGKVTTTCGTCGDVRRFPYVRERAARRAAPQ
jgi:ribonuclease P protein subunit RPR2